MNRLWLRFLPIIGILLVNLAFWQDWIDQGTWGVLLVILIAAYVLMSFVFFPMRKEIFSNARRRANDPGRPEPTDDA